MATTKVYILIAAGFNEVPVLHLVSAMRQAHLSASIVGIEAGLITGKHGIAIKTDQLFSQISADAPQMIVLADGERCTDRLLVDSRLHHLITRTLEHGGYLVTLGNLRSDVVATGILPPQVAMRLISPNDLAPTCFAQELVNRLK